MRQQSAPTATFGLGRLLASTGVSIAGQGMVIAAVPLLAASLTRQPLGVSLSVAATYAAWLAVGLPAGTLVDRWPRRATMVGADLARMALLVALAVAIALHHASIWMLSAVVFLVGVAGCFFDPAAQAATPLLVGRDPDALARANSKMWSLDMIGRSLVGPPLGAALFAAGAAIPFAGNAATFGISAVLLTGLTQLGRPSKPEAEPKPMYSSMADGVRHLLGHRDLRALTAGMGSFNLVYNVAFSTLVLFAKERLGLSDRAFGVLLAMLAVGALLGAWIAPRLRRSVSFRRLYAAGLASQAIAWFVLAVWHSIFLASAILVLVGTASMVVTVVGGAARQALTPDHLLGRVSAGTRVVGIGAAAFGALLGGATAQAFQLEGALYLSAFLAVAASAFFLVAEHRSVERSA